MGTPTLHPRPGSRSVSPPPTCARATPPGHPTVPPTGSVPIAVQWPLVSLVSTITSQFLRPRVQPFEEARPCPAPVGSSSRDTGQGSGNRHQPGELLLHRAGLRGTTGRCAGAGEATEGLCQGVLGAQGWWLLGRGTGRCGGDGAHGLGRSLAKRPSPRRASRGGPAGTASRWHPSATSGGQRRLVRWWDPHRAVKAEGAGVCGSAARPEPGGLSGRH